MCFLEGDWYEWITQKDPFVSTGLQYPMLNGLANSWRIFEEVVKLTVGNFRRSWLITMIYECSSGWSICHCCFVIVMSHVACGSTFIESLCYGLLFLFSSSKLSITFTLLDENWSCFEEQVHKRLSFLPLHSWKQANLVLCLLCYLQSTWIASQIPCTLSTSVSLILFLKMSWVLAIITALWAYLPLLRREHFFYLENAMKSGVMAL